MVLKTLVENTAISSNYNCEHGLSLYFEVADKKILFDVGSSELFLENAKKMQVNITDIDYLFLSHGHYDHGGGLKAFLKNNTKSDIFLNKNAFDKHFSLRNDGKMHYIGLDNELKENKRIVFTDDTFTINENLSLFSNIEKKLPCPIANKGLFLQENNEMIIDPFLDEQLLYINEKGKKILITGCAHNGIINIIEQFKENIGDYPDVIIGGFHLSSHGKEGESFDNIIKIGEYLKNINVLCYTCHCTGLEPFDTLKSVLKDKIHYISTGRIINI